jgi:hypothetical protein
MKIFLLTCVVMLMVVLLGSGCAVVGQESKSGWNGFCPPTEGDTDFAWPSNPYAAWVLLMARVAAQSRQ